MSDPATAVVNQALMLIGGNQSPVTGSAPEFDTSTAGQAAKYLYQPTVATVARQFGWDFSRNTAALALSGNEAPTPWSYEYLYPTNGVQVRQVMPQELEDQNNPVPIDWIVAYSVVGGAQTRVIHANLQNVQAVFTGQPGPGVWDSSFREAVVRLLASGMAMAIAGKPDAAMAMLQSYGQFESIGETRDS